MENESGIQLGGKGVFFTAVMGDRPYCKISIVIPPTATDAEIEHAAERYRKVAETFRDVVQSVVGPGWGSEPIPIRTDDTIAGALEKAFGPSDQTLREHGVISRADFAKFAESEEETEDLTAIIERYNIKKGTTDF